VQSARGAAWEALIFSSVVLVAVAFAVASWILREQREELNQRLRRCQASRQHLKRVNGFLVWGRELRAKIDATTDRGELRMVAATAEEEWAVEVSSYLRESPELATRFWRNRSEGAGETYDRVSSFIEARVGELDEIRRQLDQND
jgi:hypothetical protein